MKCLRIKNGKGQFSVDGTNYSEIDKISKDNVLKLLDVALSEDQIFEMDDYDESLLANKAHRVIYRSLHEKFISLNANKSQFTSEVDELYQDVLDKYKQNEEEASSESSPDD